MPPENNEADKQAKKLAKLRRQIEQSHGQEGDSKQLLEMILAEIAKKVSASLCLYSVVTFF